MTFIKALYFLFFFASGSMVPYLAPYLHQRGISDSSVGLIMGAGALTMLVSPLLVGILADSHVGAIRLYRLGVLLTAGMLLVFASVHSVVALWISYIVLVLVRMPCMSLLDGICFEHLEQRIARGEPAPNYEKIRIWGSFGFALASLLMFAALYELAGSSRTALLVSVAMTMVCWLFSRGIKSDTSTRKPQSLAEIFKNPAVFRLVKTRPLSTFLGVYALLMLSASILDCFNGRYFQELGIAEMYLGPISAIAVFSEVLFVALLTPWIARLGTKPIMLLGIGALLTRLLCYAGGAQLWVLLLSQILHGPMGLALYFLPQKYLEERIPTQYRNSVQGFMRGICQGLPAFAGPLIGGMLADFVAPGDVVGLQTTFWFGAASALSALIWFILGFHEPHAKRLNASVAPAAENQ